ncbi:hypothetical protein O7635_17010 [Asanoa sp. WMMD1127]|uniref:hypothetical protein n=1 Tax=Asanoa sp. WMMD1127 TaxID=3016107 RepID=UPI0024169574|nr:hypothetical protein [Asanoa sp. WMMD1127]MDG4823555.1 hypothetical protein [Asanoa sp. WMMD1127]
MGKTTISVESGVRDRLAAWAARHGRSMGEEIEVLLEIAEEHEFWEKVSAGYANGYAGGNDDEYPEYAHLGPVGPIPPPPEMVDDIPLTVHDR